MIVREGRPGVWKLQKKWHVRICIVKKKKKFGGMPSFFPLKETGENVNTLPLIDSHRAFYETNK